METQSRPEPLPSLESALDEMKRAGKELLEAYVSEGTKELLGTTGRVVLTKFIVVALSAFAIGLSLYGLIFEAVLVGYARNWAGATPEACRLATHATVLAVFSLVAIALARRRSAAGQA